MDEQLFFDVYQRPHILPKGVNPLTRRSARVIVINEHNEVLLIRTKYRHLFIFPGGAREKGESDHQAAIRECLEESGYAVAITNPEPIITSRSQFYWDGNYYYGENVSYRAALLPHDRKPVIADEEVEEVVWRKLNSIRENECYEFIWPAFARLL